MTSAFTIAPTPPTTIALDTGQDGSFSFTVTSLAAPDRSQDLILQALLVGADGKSSEVDWLEVGSPRTLTLSGGETATVTILVKPRSTTPRGEHKIKLAVADKERPHDSYAVSAPVVCEVTGKIAPKEEPKKKFPLWLIAVIVGGVLLLGGGAFAMWKVLDRAPGLGKACDPAAAQPCRDDLLCSSDKRRCLLKPGATCSEGELCDSDACVAGVCASRLGGACDPATLDRVPCPPDSHCDAATRTCLRNACRPGDKQCASDGRSLSSCDAGVWKTEACPATAPLCRDGACVCSVDQGKPCNCGGKVQCDGTCSAPACNGSCVDGKCCDAKAGQACGSCGGKMQCDGSCSVATPPNLGQACGSCGGKVSCDGSCSVPTPPNFNQACGSCGGKIQCNGSCSVATPPNFNQACGSCGGKIQCDGSCSVPTPPNFNQACGSCGGRIQCNGSCSIATPPNFNQPCGECGGRIQCNSQCSNNTPRCPAGFVVDPSTPGQCRGTNPTTVRRESFSVGGAQWDGCDPCGCGLGFDKPVSIPCGPGMVQASQQIAKIAGNGRCDGGWASNNPQDCSVNIRFSTSWCDNIKCDLTVTAVPRRPQCTP
jgi:hypothetical protein